VAGTAAAFYLKPIVKTLDGRHYVKRRPKIVETSSPTGISEPSFPFQAGSSQNENNEIFHDAHEYHSRPL
jgi:hypothetical protein